MMYKLAKSFGPTLATEECWKVEAFPLPLHETFGFYPLSPEEVI